MKIKYLKIANDETLIKRVIHGEAQAERLLYEKYAGYILGVCRRYILNFHDAEDVALVVLQKVFERLNQYKFVLYLLKKNYLEHCIYYFYTY